MGDQFLNHFFSPGFYSPASRPVLPIASIPCFVWSSRAGKRTRSNSPQFAPESWVQSLPSDSTQLIESGHCYSNLHYSREIFYKDGSVRGRTSLVNFAAFCSKNVLNVLYSTTSLIFIRMPCIINLLHHLITKSSE